MNRRRTMLVTGAALSLVLAAVGLAARPAPGEAAPAAGEVAPAATEDDDVRDEPVASAMPPLTEEEAWVIRQKGTERPFSGRYVNTFENGVYLCRQCGKALYESKTKFRSDCGWPSFDQEIPGAVRRQRDADGLRTEILCAHCGGHLGHVFEGEGFTPRNVRHCVNSVSLVFRSAAELQRAVFAGGCFWGVEHEFSDVPGVLGITAGYAGGTVPNPTYEQVCSGRTGHAEAVEIVYDPEQVSYETLARAFFEIHDPTTPNRQGNDVGTQYRSAVFYRDEAQQQVAEKLIAELKGLGYGVVTEVAPARTFYAAEEHHQDYLVKNPNGYNCHRRVPRFEQPVRR